MTNNIVKHNNKVEKKKRRKLIKSCTFCRKRKLKCDQLRPTCSTCTTRKLLECVYSSIYSPGQLSVSSIVSSNSTKSTHEPPCILNNHVPGVPFLFQNKETSKVTSIIGNVSKTPIVIINEKSVICQPRVDEHRGNNSNSPSYTQKLKNPLNEMYFLQIKKGGRSMMYGPTSMKTYIFKSNWYDMQAYHERLWVKVQEARGEWKKLHNFTSLKENMLLEDSCDMNNESIIDTLLKILPSYEKIIQIVESFFSNNDLFYYNNVLDRNKVMSDLYREFLPGSPVLPNNERPVIKLVPDEKKNYYKIGVIIMILAVSYYYQETPRELEIFFVFLTGLSTSRTFYTERVQFLFFRYIYVQTYGSTGGDNSHLLTVVSEMCTTALVIGLNEDINVSFREQENIVGRLDTLRYLWIWILYADWDVSFNIGRPLLISTASFDNDDLEARYETEMESKKYIGSFIRFVKLSRPFLTEIQDKICIPNLAKYNNILLNFIESEFSSIEYYTDCNLADEVPLTNLRIICSSLNMIITFAGLRFLVFRERSNELKNQFLKVNLIALSLSTNISMRCFLIDKEKFPHMISKEFKSLPPYLAVAIATTHTMLARALIAFFGYCYCKMTYFSKGFVFATQIEERVIDLGSLRVTNDKLYSTNSSFEIFCNIFDKWDKPQDGTSKLVLNRSYVILIMLTLERLCRTILMKIKECRTKAENDWIEQNQSDFAATMSMIKEGFCQDINVTELLNSDNIASQDILDNNVPNSLSDEFWANYFSGWEEYFNGDNVDSLFKDLSNDIIFNPEVNGS